LKDAGYQGANSYGELKQELIAQGVLTASADKFYEFARPYSFKSPSAAAAVVLDRNANGRLKPQLRPNLRSYRSPVDHFLFGDGPQIATQVALCALACRTVSSVSFFDHRIRSKAEHATASVPAEAVVVAQPARIRAGKQKQRGVHRAPCVSIR